MTQVDGPELGPFERPKWALGRPSDRALSQQKDLSDGCGTMQRTFVLGIHSLKAHAKAAVGFLHQPFIRTFPFKINLTISGFEAIFSQRSSYLLARL